MITAIFHFQAHTRVEMIGELLIDKQKALAESELLQTDSEQVHGKFCTLLIARGVSWHLTDPRNRTHELAPRGQRQTEWYVTSRALRHLSRSGNN